MFYYMNNVYIIQKKKPLGFFLVAGVRLERTTSRL